MISILCPTRGRPDILRRMVRSARDTAAEPLRLEFLVYLTPDDPRLHDYKQVIFDERVYPVTGPRRVLGECWNVLAEVATGDLLMQANDDIVFRTPGWDGMVRREFDSCPDKILMVFGDDLGCHRGQFGPHPIVHRRWVNALGYFVPGMFAGDYTDTWVNEVARILGRDRFLPFVVEHCHHLFGKAVVDETYQERTRAEQSDNWGAKYAAMAPDRARDAEKLRAVMR
jgi:hypothetical protein